MVRLISLGLLVLPSIAAYRIPQPGVLPRQGVSNSSFAPSTSLSTQTATAGSSSNAATITTAPLPRVSASGNGTCPVTSYPGNFPDHPFATFTETCQSAQSRLVYDKFYYLTDSCLASYCEAQWDSTWESIGSASTTVWTTSIRTWFSGAFGTGSLSTVVVTQEYWTSTYTFPVDTASLVTLDAPCCGQCTLADPTIQLYFWPTATADPTPSVTGLPGNATAMVTGLPMVEGTYVDDSGFTFTSPSIYLAFTSLNAHNWCGPVGSDIYNTTVAFDPTEISTMFPQVTRATCTITGTSQDGKEYTTTGYDVTTRVPSQLKIADVAQDCSTIAGYYWFADNPSNAVGDAAGDPCHPVIALPTKIQELQPAWSDCLPVYGGFYDPPKTLKQGTALVPTTASETPEPTSEEKPSQVHPTSANPEPTQADPSPSDTPASTQDPTSQRPDPTQADSTSQGPIPSASQTPAPSDPQDPSVSRPAVTVQSTDPVPSPTQSQALSGPQPSVPANPQSSVPASPQSSAPANPQSPAPASPQSPAPASPQSSAPANSQDPAPSVQPQPSQSPSDTPQQASGPAQGSSTTITITPPPSSPTSPPRPSASAPVITLGPVPVPRPTDAVSAPNTPIPGISSPNAPAPSPSNANPQSPSPPEITLKPTVLRPATSGLPSGTVVIIGTQTLIPGGSITVGGSTTTLPNGRPSVSGGTQLVLDPQGSAVIVGGTSTVNLPPAEAATPGTAPPATQPVVVTVGETTLTADASTRFTIGGQTLTGGGSVTESGTTYLLTTDEGGSTVLVAGTAGASSVASARVSANASATVGAENTRSNAEQSTSSTAKETGAPGIVPSAPKNDSAAGRISGRWSLCMIALGVWAALMV
ncbi:hypothetical protein PMIN02_010492 [Paraphaeosphaeria minitans]